MKFKFITGPGGCGKSHLLKEMTRADSSKHLIVAPTGIAAINAGGSTVHSAFRIDPSNGFVNPKIKYGALRGLKRLYVDEISMISGDLFKSIEAACAMLGVEELIAFGDLAQLKPVQGSWFFEYRKPDEIQRLTKNYRQGSDLTFAEILNRMRAGKHTISDMGTINAQAGNSKQGITLAYSNNTVNAINSQELAKLPGTIVENCAAIEGTMKSSDVQAPEVLQLKVGASIVMLNNDSSKRWQNGTRGTVEKISDHEDTPIVYVRIRDEVYAVDEYTWTKKVPDILTPDRIQYFERVTAGRVELDWIDAIQLDDETEIAFAAHTLAQGFEMKVVGSFTQFPMKLGYASTVHKSQGLTLDNVILSPEGFGSSHGLGYVALSRLTSVQGLTTLRRLKKDDFICNPKILPYL